MIFSPTPRDLPNRTLVTLPADIDISNADSVCAATMGIVDSHEGRLRLLVLDLTRTGFMDSQGVRLINEVRERLHRTSRTELRVVAAPGGLVSRVLELTGLRRDVAVYDDLTEAIES